MVINESLFRQELSISHGIYRKLDDIIIDNEHFIKRDDVVVVTNCPKGIVFVPKNLKNFVIDSNVEIMFSSSLFNIPINEITFPKSMKKLYLDKFERIHSISFEGGTELEIFQ